MIDLEGVCTQKQFGELVGISQPAVSELVARGTLRDGAPAGEWLRAYCGALREVAAGRAAAGGLDLAGERAALAREQRLRIAMQNAVTRGELAPKVLLTQVLASTAAKVASSLDKLPGMIRRRVGAIDHATLMAVREEIASCRNMVAAMQLPDVMSGADGLDDVAVELADEAAD